MRGRLITVEGGEGTGKTSSAAQIEDWARARGLHLHCLREPGGTPLGERTRTLLLAGGRVVPMAELLLFFAARAQNLARRIIPALEHGDWVLCDRFTDSSYVYQGAGRGLGAEAVACLERLVQGELRPDLTLVFDLPVEQARRRIMQRPLSDRFEDEDLDFHRRVRQAYLQLTKTQGQRCKLIDATRPPAAVQKAVRAHLDALLSGHD